MAYYSEFSGLLNKYLYEDKVTAAGLAKQLNVSPSTVTRWLAGETRPRNAEVILHIAEIFGIQNQQLVQELLTTSGYRGYRSKRADSRQVPLSESGPRPDNLIHEDIPKVTICYSWSSMERQRWVENLAKKLRRHGVDVHLDIWDLRLGQDLNSYMKTILTDEHITKILVICDRAYTEKADSQDGGVGKEVQIMMQQGYAQAESQKVIPVIAEKDNNDNPFLPSFLRNRFYIDMSSTTLEEQNYSVLLKNLYNLPVIEKPSLGSTPHDILIPMPTQPAKPETLITPDITTVIPNAEPAGYSKQTAMVRDSHGTLTLFIRLENGELGFIQSDTSGQNWSTPVVFDTTLNGQAYLHVATAIDSSDFIHVVWGPVPEAGDVKYALLDGKKWVRTEIIGTGAFARNIAVDSANHPHVVWTNVDLFHKSYNGYQWLNLESINQGSWHPDILLDRNDNVYLFVNSGGFRPKPGVSVFVIHNTDGHWHEPQKISTSPFWSGAASGAINRHGDIYAAWIGTPTAEGGNDQVFFSRRIGGQWQSPFPIGDVNWAASSTGQESPALVFDGNDVFYVCWRGLNRKNRPVIFVRALIPETSNLSKKMSGWSRIITLDDQTWSDVWWPSVADVNVSHRIPGIDITWRAVEGRQQMIRYAHVTYPSL